MKSAIIRAIIVLTAKVLSLSDKAKVRTIVGAGLSLPVSIIRDEFEALYEKAATMPLVITEFVHVRVSRRKNNDDFTIIENITNADNNETTNETIEESVVLDDDNLDNLISKAVEDINNEIAKEIIAPVVSQEPKKSSVIEKALEDMKTTFGARLAPIITPVAIVENKPEVTMPIKEMVETISNSIHNEDADLDFVTFVRDKAIEGKYPKWIQNITVANVKEYAKLRNVDVHALVCKYLVAHRDKNGGIVYFSLKTEFVIKYYNKACYSSPDRRWYVVISNNVIELYSGDGKKNTLAKKVVASEDPEQYAKAINVVKGYTFRGGELKK